MQKLAITILCSDARHPVNNMLAVWQQRQAAVHDVSLCRKKSELGEGDILFLISCAEIISQSDLQSFNKALVLHASDLPQGRGWSPHIWELVGGARHITLSLLEAAQQVDSGAIWAKKVIPVPADALFDEINDLLFAAEAELMDFAVENFASGVAKPQSEDLHAGYYRKRTPEDSEIDPHSSLAEQFDLIRVCDPQRFPAFFRLHGKTYKLILEKVADE
ncbi:UDP-glucuronic acid dehydrogenase [Pseudomonas sp. SWRI51]|uniref:formyltransferase family protein n=1 Tax=Pseudomonas sp. SWRI51 TaxID=2745491 RepID=UPI0016478C01|nr:formyltransferase family protein [Pseudomonas sp. SWRI51]MBC3410850.1 UDP-glucuronic acid dehydrogenase [Pseudomonas sp. SWRI51]